jgi:hypothetical protein
MIVISKIQGDMKRYNRTLIEYKFRMIKQVAQNIRYIPSIQNEKSLALKLKYLLHVYITYLIRRHNFIR